MKSVKTVSTIDSDDNQTEIDLKGRVIRKDRRDDEYYNETAEREREFERRTERKQTE